MNLDIGTSVGDYQIIGILGAGGMGKVYKVRNVISDRVEAMKVLLPDLANEPELADRFLREIKVQASLEHPNIAALHTALRVENQLLMFMEFVEGVTLDEKLKSGPLPVPEAVEYAIQVLAALSYAHQHGVIHRDIKPANIILTAQGVVKLMDFGIAKGSADRKLTMTGTTMGSLYYMSPEQIKGATTLDARSDLYSVGVALYELVTGRRPFDGDSQFAIMAAHLEKTPVPPVTLDPRLPEALNDIILLAVGKEADSRFQTAEAFRNALVSVQSMVGRPAGAAGARPTVTQMAAAPAQVPVLIAPTPPETPSKGHRGLWIASGGLAAAIALVLVIQFGPWKKTSAEPARQVMEPQSQAAPAATPAAVPAAQPAAAEAEAGVPAAPAAPEPAPPAIKNVPSKAAQQAAAARVPRAQTARPAASMAAPAEPQAAPVEHAPVAQPAAQNSSAAPAVRRPSPELQEIRERLVKVSSRAIAARASLDAMRNSQAASGLGMRGDMVEAASLLTSYLEGARSALNAGDADAAKDLTEKSERQVERIEKFLGR